MKPWRERQERVLFLRSYGFPGKPQSGTYGTCSNSLAGAFDQKLSNSFFCFWTVAGNKDKANGFRLRSAFGACDARNGKAHRRSERQARTLRHGERALLRNSAMLIDRFLRDME
jgi:hypothetical protein